MTQKQTLLIEELENRVANWLACHKRPLTLIPNHWILAKAEAIAKAADAIHATIEKIEIRGTTPELAGHLANLSKAIQQNKQTEVCELMAQILDLPNSSTLTKAGDVYSDADTVTTAVAVNLLDVNKSTLSRWAKAAGIKSIERGVWWKSDILRLRKDHGR